MTKPSVRVLILLCIIIHACSMNVLSELIVRPPGEVQPGDFKLQFVNQWALLRVSDIWGSKKYKSDLRLRCLAFLYHGDSFVEIPMNERIKLGFQKSEDLVFYVRPGVYSKFEVRCDYRNKEISSMGRRGGLVFWKTNKDPRTCLASQGGCMILFENGQVIQKRGNISRFLGELPQEKCKIDGLNIRLFCKEIKHNNALFGSYCDGDCGLNW